MPLILSEANHTDAYRISEIHMATFGSNKMLLAQFPMPALHEPLRKCIEMKALADIDDPKTTVLVVREESGQAVAFAKWAHPVTPDEDYVEPPWIWPEGTNMEVLEGWTKKTEEAQQKALGETPCYRLTFIGTDPLYERRGAASQLVGWGMQQCEMHNVPAYLESTLEAAAFYGKQGFAEVETFSMEIPCIEGNGSEQYQETSFVFNRQ
ncbi:hypothetical protein M426DRAFT_324423 [Hypoxylon sp. CI-4A]|nr:hypothetical protein M426DRAFT_324423 [Hypoxylon sp. CI-4A]